MPAPQYLYLTTIGRRTGLRREIEIWFTERAGRYYVIAEHGERAQWVRNLRQNPQISLRVGERECPGSARILDPVQDEELWREVCALSESKYGWSDGLVVELIPEQTRK